MVVRPFAAVDYARLSVSLDGGMGPVWSKDGSELFYVEGGQVWAAQIESDPSLSDPTFVLVHNFDEELKRLVPN